MKRLVGILALETALIGLLHRSAVMFPVDWSNLAVWIQFTPTDQMLMGAVRCIALFLAYWLLLSTIIYTVIYAVGRLARLPRLIRSVEWATLSMVRNAARRAVALSLATSTMAPTVAVISPMANANQQTVEDGRPSGDAELRWEDQQTDTVVIGVSDGGAYIPPGATIAKRGPTSQASVPTPRLAEPASNPSPPAPLLPPVLPAVAKAEAATREAPSSAHLVVRGDSLWTIAAGHLRAEHLRAEGLRADLPDVALTEQGVASYWARLVELNHLQLRSQNPDLIFPGEVIELPPTES